LYGPLTGFKDSIIAPILVLWNKGSYLNHNLNCVKSDVKIETKYQTCIFLFKQVGWFDGNDVCLHFKGQGIKPYECCYV
jgi:hypothetical protein